MLYHYTLQVEDPYQLRWPGFTQLLLKYQRKNYRVQGHIPKTMIVKSLLG